MNIVMMTNTYKPIVGGLERSVETFSREYMKRGHNVLIIVPEMERVHKDEPFVFRVPAIKNFKGTEFSVELPVSLRLNRTLAEFKPDIIHSHHPFLIGDTALRASAAFNVPIVFTYHSMYEKNVYFINRSKALQAFVIKLAVGYANLCDRVIAPSPSVAELMARRGVRKPITVIPTGIWPEDWTHQNRLAFRKFYDIPPDAFVVGFVSRIAPEKNVTFLARSVARFLKNSPNACFLVVGDGPSLPDVKTQFKHDGLKNRLILTGTLQGQQLSYAYSAIDVFTFASHSETQGIILLEAMAAGKPVLAVDAPGVREVVRDKINGRLLKADNKNEFVRALNWFQSQPPRMWAKMSRNARTLAGEYSVSRCVDRVLRLYEETCAARKSASNDEGPLEKTVRMLKTQLKIMGNTAKATGSAVKEVKNKIFLQTSKPS